MTMKNTSSQKYTHFVHEEVSLTTTVTEKPSKKKASIEEVLSQANKHFTLSKNESGIAIPELLEALIKDAVAQSASDIHLFPRNQTVAIQYRIDGSLYMIGQLHENVWRALVVHIKVLGNLNIAESYLPQGGRFQKSLDTKNIEVRISTHPTNCGESIVLRLLGQKENFHHLSQIGFLPNLQKAIIKVIQRNEGLFIVTGPTGSGKTTTLYAILQTIQTPHLNIVTLEQPIEYRMKGVKQTEIQEDGKLSFEAGVRSLLRQDPDIILIGETRDTETAKMVFRATMTGHQTFTTLHTKTAQGVLQRLKDLDVPDTYVKENISGVLAQRLCRCLCHTCKKPHQFTYNNKTYKGFRPNGCKACRQSGYLGRLPIAEFLVFSKEKFENLPTIEEQIFFHIEKGNLFFEDIQSFLETA